VGIKGEPWAECPLKHEIRASLWEPYVRKLTGSTALRSYLTLYSTSLMDVKYFADRGLVVFDGEVYRGVVGVTFVPEAFAEAVRRGQGRPEKLLTGDIREILTETKTSRHKELREKFPFDAVNLDYTDSLFRANTREPVPRHLKALETLFKMQSQNNCERFCLFLTTRGEVGQFAHTFLSQLEHFIDENISISPEFEQAFFATYNVNTGKNLAISAYEDFATLGLIKLVVSMLSDFQYAITDCNAVWLMRDVKGGGEGLLHLAFLIDKQQNQSLGLATRVSQYGRKRLQYHARRAVTYLNSRAANGLRILRESLDQASFMAKHGAEISKLMSQTYQLAVPQQILEQEE